MLGIFKKKKTAPEPKIAGEENDECSGDESCPMCQVSDEVMGVFEENNRGLKGTDPNQDRNKRVRP